jgi:hypothetical protein
LTLLPTVRIFLEVRTNGKLPITVGPCNSGIPLQPTCFKTGLVPRPQLA